MQLKKKIMKKVIVILATLSLICSVSASNYTYTTKGIEPSYSATSAWEYCGSVTIKKKSGNMWISNQNHRVERDSETGDLRIEYGDSWYSVRSSNMAGFEYMFSTGRGYWYFNL